MVRTSREHASLARQAKLRYVADDVPGILRKRHGRGFRYEYANHRPVTSEKQLERIRQLAIPPAWSEVWICKSEKGHLQATGRDDANRKQYLYHEKWQEKTNVAKFDQLLTFGQQLPKLRRAAQRAMQKRNPAERRMLALLVRILDETGIRIGNETYAKENDSYGLTTLLGKHLKFSQGQAELHFAGKSKQKQEVIVADKKNVRFLKSIKPKANGPLFGYEVDGAFHRVDAQEVNAFVQQLAGQEFSTKDFRTWIASARFAWQLYEAPAVEKNSDLRRTVKESIDEVADFLGHTPTICKRYYIHPGLATAYEAGKFPKLVSKFRPRRRKGLRPADQLLTYLLKKGL